jgi:hypothetical protein
MKKFINVFIIAFLMMFAFNVNSNAQTYAYRGFQAAYKYVENGRWTDWTAWKNVNVIITIDYDNDIIRVHANSPQMYVVTNYDGSYTDSSGGQQVQFSVVDQDYDAGKIRLRIERNGNSQVYVEFADVILVWNVVKI